MASKVSSSPPADGGKPLRFPRGGGFGVLIGWLLLVITMPWLAGQGQYTFRSWQSEDGLPVNLVRSIVQAADGHIWIATAEGIARFDGIEFQRIDPVAGFTFPHSGPNRLFATSDGAIWFSSFRGGLLRISDGKTTIIWPDVDSPESPPVTQLIEVPNRGIHIRRDREIWSYAKGKTTRLKATDTALLACFDADRDERARTGRIETTGSPGHLVDRGGSVWSVSPKGELKVTSPEGQVRPVSMPRVSADFQVTEMLLDREGNIWVATALNGLGLFREERVDVLNAAAGLSEASVFAVIEDSRGQVWIGNRRGGVDRIRDGKIEHHDLPPASGGPVVSALYEDRDGRLWAATTEGPVFVWRESQFVGQFQDLENGPAKINAIYHDKDGTLWFGGQQGLIRSTGRRVTHVESEAGFPGGEVTAMAGGAADELWLGTAQGFILRNVAGRLLTIATPGDLSYSRVSAILVIAPDQVWVTTMGAGLFLFDGDHWHRFDRLQGLPDLRLTSVIDDQFGHLWFGSSGGILRASRADLLARTKNPDAPIHWLRMDRADGLPTRECVAGHQPSGWRFSNGSIWFPTNLGMVRLDPSRTMVNRTPPPVFLRSITAGGVDLKPGEGELRIGPGRTRLEFHYHGLNFSAPEKVTYRTRLVGLDDTWREDGPQRLATYESVPPGHYRFEVLATNGDGFQSLTPAIVRLEIRPHFWETGWFIAQVTFLVMIVAGGVGWIIARSRLNRRITALKIRHARETERARIARDLHDDLGASLTEFSLLTDLGAEKAVGSPFQSQIEQLSDKSRALGLALDEIVWAVNPREDTLASLIDYLATFATEFLDRAGITLRLDIATGLPPLPLDAAVRHSVFLAVREAFNNLVKHSHARTAWLIVTYQNGILEVVVEDDGRGVVRDGRPRGEGLSNFETRMQACNGTVSISPRPDGGTSVRFLIPVLAS